MICISIQVMWFALWKLFENDKPFVSALSWCCISYANQRKIDLEMSLIECIEYSNN